MKVRRNSCQNSVICAQKVIKLSACQSLLQIEKDSHWYNYGQKSPNISVFTLPHINTFFFPSFLFPINQLNPIHPFPSPSKLLPSFPHPLHTPFFHYIIYIAFIHLKAISHYTKQSKRREFEEWHGKFLYPEAIIYVPNNGYRRESCKVPSLV